MKAISTRYHGPTNTRGSRITATDRDGNRVTIEYDDALNSEDNHKAAARALIIREGWKGEYVMGWLGSDAVFVDICGDRFEIYRDEVQKMTTKRAPFTPGPWRVDETRSADESGTGMPR